MKRKLPPAPHFDRTTGASTARTALDARDQLGHFVGALR